jgi:hypothetical protein
LEWILMRDVKLDQIHTVNKSRCTPFLFQVDLGWIFWSSRTISKERFFVENRSRSESISLLGCVCFFFEFDLV